MAIGFDQFFISLRRETIKITKKQSKKKSSV